MVQAGVEAATLVATSALAYVEARAALARRRQAGDLTPAEHRRLLRRFEDDWDRYLQIDVTTAVLRDAADLAESARLRAYDAVHLASARVVRERAADVTFACWDRTLQRAARQHGFRTLG
jgi:predicted nucleic acid-binding protein